MERWFEAPATGMKVTVQVPLDLGAWRGRDWNEVEVLLGRGRESLACLLKTNAPDAISERVLLRMTILDSYGPIALVFGAPKGGEVHFKKTFPIKDIFGLQKRQPLEEVGERVPACSAVNSFLLQLEPRRRADFNHGGKNLDLVDGAG